MAKMSYEPGTRVIDKDLEWMAVVEDCAPDELGYKMAAAEDMYEALKELANSLRHMSNREAPVEIVQAACDSLASKADAALAKAEGKA